MLIQGPAVELPPRMLIQEFREIFHHEIEGYVAKIHHKSSERSRDASHCSARSADGTIADALDSARVDELRQLSYDMTDSILQRLADHVAFRGLEETAPGCNDFEPKHAQQELDTKEDPEEHARLEMRHRELERKLRLKQAEEHQLSADLCAKFQVESEDDLQEQVQVLKDAGALRPEMYCQLAERIARVQSRLKVAKTLVSEVSTMQINVAKVEEQQSKDLCLAEGWLTRQVDIVDEDDQKLLDAILKGEQVCNRMRCRFAGA